MDTVRTLITHRTSRKRTANINEDDYRYQKPLLQLTAQGQKNSSALDCENNIIN